MSGSVRSHETIAELKSGHITHFNVNVIYLIRRYRRSCAPQDSGREGVRPWTHHGVSEHGPKDAHRGPPGPARPRTQSRVLPVNLAGLEKTDQNAQNYGAVLGQLPHTFSSSSQAGNPGAGRRGMNREGVPGKSPEEMYIQQKVRVLLMLRKMGSNLTASEEEFLRTYAGVVNSQLSQLPQHSIDQGAEDVVMAFSRSETEDRRQ
ncbi:beta-catenin-interacting protein 1 [Patagioenas fasciata monilis]|uniref:Beta-catenin-interacting protein 1 n=1 Tax=Patagioenas fasciata monilis TaxID=372326 RepID=A0A1V4KNZ0_PATFA|nr:beta-catenin-interacting protein 1 [Patagioenas fasciata monilis]